MNFIKLSVYSNTLLSLTERKQYLDTLYMERPTYQKDKKRNMGFIHKFNNAIGFKNVSDEVTSIGTVIRAKETSPEEYLNPGDLIFDAMQTPVDTYDIFVFHIPNQTIIHPNPQYTYNTLDIAAKWKSFLEKVFPKLHCKIEFVEEKPKQTIRDFAFEFFYRSLERGVNCTIEFSSSVMLSDEDLNYVLPKVQVLVDDIITVSQRNCEVCKHNTFGEKDIHIEIVYLTYYGTNVLNNAINDYGDSLFLPDYLIEQLNS